MTNGVNGQTLSNNGAKRRAVVIGAVFTVAFTHGVCSPTQCLYLTRYGPRYAGKLLLKSGQKLPAKVAPVHEWSRGWSGLSGDWGRKNMESMQQ